MPQNPDSSDRVRLVERRVGPFMSDVFPERQQRTILLDGENLFHTEEAKAMMRKWGIRVLPDWPAHSPDLNPQENVWAWAEPRLRKIEARTDTLQQFKHRVISVCLRYPSASKLAGSLEKRVTLRLKKKGANIGK